MPVLIVLPGAGNNAPDPALFRGASADATRVEIVRYPGWRRYVENGYSAEALVRDLAREITTRAGGDPIRIVGMSIGGHLGYAAARYLEGAGRPVEGLCAVDAFMVSSAALRPGWARRMFGWGADLLRKRRARDFMQYVRSLFWRGVFRSTGDRLAGLCRSLASHRALESLLCADQVFERELGMRLLVRLVNPWMATLDVAPTSLKAPAILLRTGSAALHDVTWQKRCPLLQIFEIPGDHNSTFEPENAGSFHQVFLTATSHWR